MTLRRLLSLGVAVDAVPAPHDALDVAAVLARPIVASYGRGRTPHPDNPAKP
jgi:hypothetical protein